MENTVISIKEATHLLQRWMGTWVWACVILAGVTIVGCSGGGDGGSGTMATASTGQAMVSLTDAAGDFLTYAVDVQSLTLTRRDGTVVETLPARHTREFF